MRVEGRSGAGSGGAPEPAAPRRVGARLSAVGRAVGGRLRRVGHRLNTRLEPSRRRLREAWHRVSPPLLRRPPVSWFVRANATVRQALRRSLQLRVVTITTVLSTVLVGAFGFLVASSITGGLLEDKIASAENQVREGGDYAARQLKVVTQADDPALRTAVPTIVAALGDPGRERGFDVAMLPTNPNLRLNAQSSAFPNPDAYQVMTSPRMAKLRQKVGIDGKMAYQLTTANADRQGTRQYLIFGTRVELAAGGGLELYYLFPLDQEVQTANRVRNTVILTGVTLVLCLALVSALVTRLVVHPVRMAARTAQRLSAGLLDQRMEVRGEDDLARLATSFNHMAANLQRQIVRLEEMSRLQRRFTSDVSHELRTPLTTVRMAADLMFSSRDRFEPAVARSAELLQTELDRFEALLADLLEISRFDAGFAMLDVEPVDLGLLVRRVVEGLVPLADRAGSRVRLDLADAPVIADVDPRRVERILRNLVGNAVEHSEGKPVRVIMRADEVAVAVAVRDHGVGLKPGEEELAFNRFWRADPSRARQTGGTGLGLSISLEDARLHGGWLQAWGRPGEGAQFRLTLPLRPGERLTASPLPLEPDDIATSPAPPGDPDSQGVAVPAGAADE